MGGAGWDTPTAGACSGLGGLALLVSSTSTTTGVRGGTPRMAQTLAEASENHSLWESHIKLKTFYFSFLGVQYFFPYYEWHGASLVAQLVKKLPAVQEPQFNYWVGKIPCRRDRLPTPVFLGFPGGSDSEESTCDAGELGLIPGLGRCPGGGHGIMLP